MKKWLRLACTGAVLAGVLTASAFAADETSCAERLHDLGLFRGTAQGYELDRAPTRAEAATMLVRLLGAEEQAQALVYTAPYTDLAGWEQPYVQYLYENRLTNGTSDSTFGPDEQCSAQMYAAFLLRALGYTEAAGDFTYADAVAAAQACGAYDPAVIDTADFLRGDVAEASYTALSVTPKGGEGTLLDQLVQEGAVDAQAAAPYQQLFDQYADYRADAAGMADLDAFTVHGGMTAEVSGTDGYALTVRTEDDTTVSQADGTAVCEGTLTMESPSVKSYTQTYRRESASLTGWEQRAMLYGYGAVPLACMDELTHQGNTWRFVFDSLPPLYAQSIQALSESGGIAWEPGGEAVLAQIVRNGRIASQTLDLAWESGTLHVTASVTGEMDTAE